MHGLFLYFSEQATESFLALISPGLFVRRTDSSRFSFLTQVVYSILRSICPLRKPLKSSGERRSSIWISALTFHIIILCSSLRHAGSEPCSPNTSSPSIVVALALSLSLMHEHVESPTSLRNSIDGLIPTHSRLGRTVSAFSWARVTEPYL